MARVLVIDDVISNVMLLRHILEDDDHGVITAANGAEGLRLAEFDQLIA